jgi:hypothetical protein
VHLSGRVAVHLSGRVAVHLSGRVAVHLSGVLRLETPSYVYDCVGDSRRVLVSDIKQ